MERNRERKNKEEKCGSKSRVMGEGGKGQEGRKGELSEGKKVFEVMGWA